MRALKILVVVMGVMIVVMLTTVLVTLARRATHPAAPAAFAAATMASLVEPPGTRIVAISPAGNSLAVLLQGGGADRILFLDAAGRVVARVGLVH